MSLHKKIQSAFSASSSNFYKREDVIKKMKEFISSKKDFILHLTGNPGCGKTSITKYICKNINHEFLNSYNDDIKKKIVLNDKIKLWVIDEFDKIEDSKFIINYIKTHKKKMITLSNSLNLKKTCDGINISLKPYTSKDIEDIIRYKCKEVGHDIISDLDIKIICKMFGRTGDMRLVFNFIRDSFDKNSQKIVLQNLNVEKEETGETNLHHRIIKEIIPENHDRRKAYSVYIEKCDSIGVPSLYRNDFYAVYDVYK